MTNEEFSRIIKSWKVYALYGNKYLSLIGIPIPEYRRGK
jgi:hypothetical protein